MENTNQREKIDLVRDIMAMDWPRRLIAESYLAGFLAGKRATEIFVKKEKKEEKAAQ